ncbi:hypothetical protein TNCV_2602521 [Trichonephila clavipes]|nr:hypothetical protein TNCV_2602521 [Trichonephila clavipes]
MAEKWFPLNLGTIEEPPCKEVNARFMLVRASLVIRTLGSLVARVSDSRPEGLVPCLNCGGRDRWCRHLSHTCNFHSFPSGRTQQQSQKSSRWRRQSEKSDVNSNVVMDRGSELLIPSPIAFELLLARRRFVKWAQNEIAVVPDFHKRISFSDEAHFWLNGYVNKQNCRIWSEANPQVYVETPLHPEKLTVWCALWAGGNILQKR